LHFGGFAKWLNLAPLHCNWLQYAAVTDSKAIHPVTDSKAIHPQKRYCDADFSANQF
jgi:hypothetical protein